MMVLPPDLLEALEAHRRTAWLPITEPGDELGLVSKFAGTPLLRAGEAYPVCGRCGKPMSLFVQLDLDGLPAEMLGPLGSGVLQMFYCTTTRNCTISGDPDDWIGPYARHQLIRRIPTKGLTPAAPPRFDRLRPRTIVGWEPADDYPNAYELDVFGIDLDDDLRDALEDNGFRCLQADKLLGWPAWVQNVDYPACRVCGRFLWPILSLESGQNLDYQFGDSGCGHLMGCPDHPDELGFTWQCL